MEDQTGAPEREREIVVQDRAAAYLQMREPGKGEISFEVAQEEESREIGSTKGGGFYPGNRCHRRRLFAWAWRREGADK